LLRALVLRGEGRLDEDDRYRLRIVELGLAHGGDALQPLDAFIEALGGIRVAVHVDDDRDGAVEARPEALCQEIVGAAGRLFFRLRPLVGSP
jgi:hypothetical protein